MLLRDTVEGFYFELTCDDGSQAEAKQFCESRGGWLAEPKTKEITNGLLNVFSG